MEDNISAADFAEKLKHIKKIPTGIPKWLSTCIGEIHKHHTKFRDLVRGTEIKWSDIEYCEHLGQHYYNLASLHYKIYQQHEINLKSVKTLINKCLSTFENIRHLQNGSKRIANILSSATKLSNEVNDIYAGIDSNVDGFSSNHHKASLIGTSENDELDLATPASATFHTNLFCIKVIDFISQIEEIFSQNTEINYFVKHELYFHLAEAYNLCKQVQLYDYYMAISNEQLEIYARTAAIDDPSYLKKRKIRQMIENAIKIDYMSFDQVKSVVMQTYTDCPNSLEDAYIERKYIKYLLKYYLIQLDHIIDTISQTGQQEFNELLSVLDIIKSMDDIPNFLHGDYYQLLQDNNMPLIPIFEKRKFIKQFKVKCWNAIKSYAVTAQKEVELLKHIILYIRTALDPRSVISKLKIELFCYLSVSTQEFIGNILLLHLEETKNKNLNELQASAYAIKGQSSLFLMTEFVNALYPYVLPVEPTVKTVNGRCVIELKEKLIIFSEVYKELLSRKTPEIQELHLVASDIHIDTNLTKDDWSGINILIVSQCINIHGKRTWDVGGYDGQQHNSPAANGIENGENGKNGADGFDGTSGGNIYVSCQEIINSENLTLKSTGGNGGNGQTGGNGMPGQKGKSIILANFKPLITPPKPKIQILHQCNGNIANRWSNNNKFRFNFWAPGHKFLRGITSDGQIVTYSYFAGSVSANNEQYLLFQGTPGQIGGQLGQGGYGGSGGFGGEICINCSQPVAVNIENKTGKLGELGENGINGEPGANGSDMGHVYVNGCFSSVTEIIGEKQNSKIIRKFHKNRNEKNFVYCCYREFCEEDDCYVQLIPISNKQSVHERHTNNIRDQRKQTHVEAVRVNAISIDVIEKHQENITDDVIDVVSNLQDEFGAIGDYALDRSIEKDKENDSEMTEFQMRRQAVFDDTKFEYNWQKLKMNIDPTPSISHISSYIQDVILNPIWLTPWLSLKNVYIAHKHFDELFKILNTHRTELSDNFGEIYCFLVEKYKYVICNRIAEMNLSLNKTDKLYLGPVRNFLKRSAVVQDFKLEDLGILNNFFRDTNKEQLENLIKYSEQLSLGSILYPIKYFLMEKCHNDEEFKRKSEHFTIDLETFHMRLERLMACHQTALLEDRDSAILEELKRRKLKIEASFATSDSSIIPAFHDHIRQHGVSSTSVRELLAYIFDCNIKIYVPNEHMQLILHHDHNPSASNVFYLLLQNGGCTQLVIDSDYKELVLERKNTAKYYSSVSSRVDKFVCKRQFDEFLEDISLIGTKHVGKDCSYCNKKKKKTLMQLLLQHFPELSRANIETQINKLARKVGEHKELLCIVLQHFDTIKHKGADPFACEQKLIEFLDTASLIDIKLDVTTPHSCTYCRKKSDIKLIELILQHFPVIAKAQVETKLNKLTTKYIKDKSVLCALWKRFNVEGVQVSFEELSYFVNAILKSLIVTNHTDISTFQWILTAYPQEKWLNEIFYLELQNYFHVNLDNKRNLITNIRNIQQKGILLLMEAKLCDENDKADLKCVEKCLNILNETVIDIELIEKLPLSKWPYVFREQYLEFKLDKITTWKMEELQKAMHYLIKLECNFGVDLIDEFLKIMLEKNSVLTSNILLEILTYLHTQEWSLNEEMLVKLKSCDVHKIQEVLGNSLNKYEERSLDTLLNLIKGNSHTSTEICQLVSTKTFHNHPFFTVNNLESLNAEDIEKWSKQFRNELRELSKSEDKQNLLRDNRNTILDMITKAIQLKRNFFLTKTQQIAILLLLTHNHSTLAQISTGEGKTLIVVAAAIFKALCNEKVDIITSSSVLAVRDAKINADIYELFGVKVAHNCAARLNERKEAYSGSDVIYGTLSNFQRDYLLDRFFEKNVIGNRNLKNLFVDEVDNMLLDKGNNTLYLSHDIPGLDKLESVYLFIWNKIVLYSGRNDTDMEQILKDAVLFDLHGTLSTNDLKNVLKMSQVEASDIFHWLVDIKVLNLKNVCLQSFSKVNEAEIPEKYQLYRDKLTYITENILNRVKEITVPKCFNNFIESHLNVWIKNAILAAIMEDRQDYVLDIDRTASRGDINPIITIIDKGTGTDQNNSEWEEALHQFLQLKHGCKVSPQSLKAVFISNVTYFKKYQTLFGLTGTLGSQTERDLLQTLYNVHFVNIPPAKQKRLTENQPILCTSLSEWQSQIVNRTKALLLEQRSVLIICETIKVVNDIHREFKSKKVPNVTAYKREHETCTVTQNTTQLKPGHVIIATNLAGRGTDIKINEVLNKAGGLHVLLIYLPSNIRIEQQAFGRAARSGCDGSAQLIIRGSGSFLNMATERDMQELQRISDMKQFYDTRITAEQTFFEEFTEVYRELRNNFAPPLFKEIALMRIIDRWAYWLDENGMKLQEDRCHAVFRSFLSELKTNFLNWSSWNNDPVALIKLGTKHLESKSYQTAIQIFDFIITEEPVFCEAAHYYKAAALAMSLNFENRPFNGDDSDKLQQCRSELTEAERKFENRKDACNVAAALVQNLKESLKKSFVQIDAFKNQQENLVNIYDIFSESIQNVNGRAVFKSAFEDLNIDITSDMSTEIYDSLIDGKVLKKAKVIHVEKDDLTDISTNYGISVNTLLDFMRRAEWAALDEDTFLRELKTCIELPTLEDFWATLIRQKKLKEEIVFVIVDKAKLINQEDLLKDIPKLTININLNDKKHVYMKKVTHIDNASCYIVEINRFKTAVGLKLFEDFKRQGIISINKIATIDTKNSAKYLNKFDYVVPKHLESDNISANEINDIFQTLTENGTLKEESLNRYRFVGKYDETNLNSIHVYNQSVVNVFRIRFSYKNALEKMLVSLKESDTPVFVDLTTELHTNLMWDMIETNLIEPVKMETINETKITDIIERFALSKNHKKHIKNVLNNMISSLERIECPVFNLVPIEEYFKEMQSSLTDELSACKLNGFSFILTAIEKKWTRKMISSVISVIAMALVQLALGLAIQLSSLAMATQVGGFLMGEGIADLIYTISCWKTGYFSWDSYKHHKLQSMMLSIVSAGIGKFLSFSATVSKFGSKIATTEAVTIATTGAVTAGEEVAVMAGKELIKSASSKKMFLEVGKTLTRKTCESILTEVVNITVTAIIESCLQNLFTTLSETILNDVDEELREHPINITLRTLYHRLGPMAAQERVMSYTESLFSEARLRITLIDSHIKIFRKTCLLVAETITQNKNVANTVLMTVLNSVLDVVKFFAELNEIRQSVHKILNNVNNQMCEDIEHYEHLMQESLIDQEDFDYFKLNILSKWRSTLSENAKIIFERNVKEPSMDECLQLIMKNARKRKNNFKAARIRINRFNFKNKKLPVKEQLSDKSLHTEVKTKLIRDYQDSLMKLRCSTRDYNLYADLVFETRHMDSVCLKSFVNMFQHSEMPSKVIVIQVEVQDSGITEEYRSDYSVGEPQVIRLKLENNHYTNRNGGDNVVGYDCLYHALVTDLPELQTIGPSGFRQSICNTIRTDTAVQEMIARGHHRFSISNKPYGEFVGNTKQIHDELVVRNETNAFSHSNVADYINLCNIADPIQNKAYIGNPVNAVLNHSGGLTFVNNRRIVAASTIDNPGDVRFFGNDELHHREDANIATHISRYYKKKETTATKINVCNSVENIFTIHRNPIEMEKNKRYILDPRNYMNWNYVTKVRNYFEKSKEIVNIQPAKQRSRSANRV